MRSETQRQQVEQAPRRRPASLAYAMGRRGEGRPERDMVAGRVGL
jgi:hypothetical protein